jgi:hypothetical protein
MSFISLIPAWGWADIFFTLVVLFGVFGELDWTIERLFPESGNDLLPPKSKRKLFKHIAESCVVLGIAGELVCLAVSLRESSKLNKDAADARLETKRLEAQIAETSVNVANLEPRRLTAKQIFELANFLRVREHVEGLYVNIVYPEGDSEAQKFSEDIFHALGDARMNVAPPSPRRFFSSVQGLFIGTNPFKPPPLATNLISGFALVGISTTITYPFENPSYATNFDVIVGSQEHSFLSGQYSEMYFNWRGMIITDWGNGIARFVITNGIHIFPDGNKTHLNLEFNRSFEVPPLVRHIMPPFGEAIGERGQGLSWDFDLPGPPSITDQTDCWYDLRIAY